MIDVLGKICGVGSRLQPIWNLVGILVNVIMIGVPILLIIFGMIDFYILNKIGLNNELNKFFF